MKTYKNANIVSSFSSALKGVAHGAGGRNFVIQILTAAASIALAYYLPITTTERHTIIILATLVLSAELFNTTIEELADVLIQEHHPGIARVKELAAAGVLIIASAAAVIGVSIFLPHLLKLLA